MGVDDEEVRMLDRQRRHRHEEGAYRPAVAPNMRRPARKDERDGGSGEQCRQCPADEHDVVIVVIADEDGGDLGQRQGQHAVDVGIAASVVGVQGRTRLTRYSLIDEGSLTFVATIVRPRSSGCRWVSSSQLRL